MLQIATAACGFLSSACVGVSRDGNMMVPSGNRLMPAILDVMEMVLDPSLMRREDDDDESESVSNSFNR